MQKIRQRKYIDFFQKILIHNIQILYFLNKKHYIYFTENCTHNFIKSISLHNNIKPKESFHLTFYNIRLVMRSLSSPLSLCSTFSLHTSHMCKKNIYIFLYITVYECKTFDYHVFWNTFVLFL